MAGWPSSAAPWTATRRPPWPFTATAPCWRPAGRRRPRSSGSASPHPATPCGWRSVAWGPRTAGSTAARPATPTAKPAPPSNLSPAVSPAGPGARGLPGSWLQVSGANKLPGLVLGGPMQQNPSQSLSKLFLPCAGKPPVVCGIWARSRDQLLLPHPLTLRTLRVPQP